MATWPVAGLKPGQGVLNPYGGTQYRSAGFDGNLPPYNTGIDIAVAGIRGVPVLAPVAGVIEQVFSAAGVHHGYGNSVLVRGEDGSRYRLSHLADTPALKPGQRVGEGQPVGRVGRSGNATGDHLDFEFYPGKNTGIKTGHGGTANPMATNFTDVPALHSNNTPASGAPPPGGPGDGDQDDRYVRELKAVIAEQERIRDESQAGLKALERQYAALTPKEQARQITTFEAEAERLAVAAETADERAYEARTELREALKTASAPADEQKAVALETAKIGRDRAQIALDQARAEAAEATDPLEKRAKELAVQQAEASLARADQEMARANALLPGQLAAQDLGNRRTQQQIDQEDALFPGVAASQDLSNERAGQVIDQSGVLFPGQVVSQDLANERGRQAIDQDNSLFPGRLEGQGITNQQGRASVAATEFETGRGQAKLPGELEQQGADVDSTRAITESTRFDVERGRAKLPGELSQQGATLDSTRATTANTRATTPTTLEVETRQRQGLADTLKAEYDNAITARTQAIQDLVARGNLSEADGLRFLGKFDELLQSQLQQRKQEQEASQTALDSYATRGVASAPFVGNVLQATAPTQGLEAAARNLGLDMSNPIVQGVQSALARVGDMAFARNPNAEGVSLPGLPASEDRTAEITAQAQQATAPPPAPVPPAFGAPASPQMAAAPVSPAAAPMAVPGAWGETTEIAEDLGDGTAQNYIVGSGGYRQKRGDPYQIGGGGMARRYPAAY